MKLFQLYGPFNAGNKINLYDIIKDREGEQETTYLFYAQIGIHIPYSDPIMKPLENNQGLEGSVSIQNKAPHSNNFVWISDFKVNDFNILEFKGKFDKRTTIVIKKNLPPHTIIDVAYTLNY